MNRLILLLACIVYSQPLAAQTIKVDVWSLIQPFTPPQPSQTASVRISTAANVPPGATIQPQRPVPSGPNQNQYILDASQFGSVVDVTCRQTGHHPWTVRDLYVGSGSDQDIHVQLFRYDYPIKAPQCFALKTEYELLFRTEQRLTPHVERKEIQRRARLKYAGGLLALPNPSRQDFQSPATQQMLAEMTYEDRDELDDMLNGLFKLYDMDGFVRYTPSVWQTSYVAVNGQTVNSEVRLFGNHGTYSTPGRTHVLDNIDIVTEETQDGNFTDIITGTWRFSPGSPNESAGTFRWTIDGSGDHFNGTFQMAGGNQTWNWTGNRLEMQIRNEFNFRTSGIDEGIAAPAVEAPAPAEPPQ